MDKQISPMRRVPLSATYNTRDLGGYPAGEGRWTKWGVFYRSDAPLSLDETDLMKLKERDIRTAIDLRTEDQIRQNPSALSRVEGITYYHCPFAVGNRDPKVAGDVPDIYMELLSNRDTIRKVMGIAANAEGALLFHCAVGKDRTGLVAMLLLSAAGVGRLDILADYQISHTCLSPLLARMRQENPSMPSCMGRSDSEYMEETLRRLSSCYRDVADYLLDCSVTQEQMQQLRRKFLDM